MNMKKVRKVIDNVKVGSKPQENTALAKTRKKRILKKKIAKVSRQQNRTK